MNEMEMWEVSVLFENIQFCDSTLWETARLMCYFMSAPYMKDSKPINEFFPLPWDVNKIESHTFEITDEEIERMKKESARFEKILKGGN